ncbi:hypothetical protein PSTT_07163 [Puccinia striiformis]|uniref:Uncharacterized protein n=1 Tax=Puccinia striiformis TaxID=27350 RepID=A0A2S4VHH4_9BASI|nr:hypothetical protein PSTT_07163 [Puccinia striiformis]
MSSSTFAHNQSSTHKSSPTSEQNDYHWSQTAFHCQRTPMILKLTQTELDALLNTYQIKDNITNHLNNHSLSLNPYGPPPTSNQSSPLNSLIKTSLNNLGEYDALALPLTNPTWKARWESFCVDQTPAPHHPPQPNVDSQPALDNSHDAEFWRRAGYFLSSELNFHNTIEVTKCICFASEWLELDAPSEGIRFDCELAIKQEVSYATYLSASHLILPRIRHRRFISDYGRAISSILAGLPSSVILSIIVPISETDEKTYKAWEDWHSLRKLCGYHSRLNITLEIPHLGAGVDTASLISRWTSEPIGFLLIPATSFISNAKHYPVLSKSCQTFVKAMFKSKPSVILSQTSEGKHSSGGSLAYVQYIRFLEKRAAAIVCDPIESFAAGYLDYLQAPLQPLADNLDSVVYEGFEKDPVKYSKYEEAIFQALCDRPADATQVLAVCGAGRGPLVEAALRAARRADRVITITAIEKIPIRTSQRLRTDWDPEVVKVWFGDMRDYQPIDPIDIIISELLGSFGDNELSPECLDGVIRWLAADGISIPCGYRSYVAPLASSKIYSRVLELGKFETPYVVMIHSAEIISAQGGPDGEMGKVQETWSFAHPRTDLVFSHDTGVPITNFHNARSSHLTFHIPQPSVCHGLAAYFRATLYGDVTIETLPDTRMSREMLSWFPMFFPLKEPIYCPKNSELDVHLWSQPTKPRPRRKSARRVKSSGSPPPTGRSTSSTQSTSKKKSKVASRKNTDPSTGESGAEQQHQTDDDDDNDNDDHSSGSGSDSHSDSEVVMMDDDQHKESTHLDQLNSLDLHFDSRVKISTSLLHNVLGKESSVKW